MGMVKRLYCGKERGKGVAMIRISNIKIPPDQTLTKKTVAKALGVDESEIISYTIFKRSVDARKKDSVHYVYTLDVIVKNEAKIKNATKIKNEAYTFPKGGKKDCPPLIVGSGPAGLMCALVLAEAGYKPILIEQGEDADTRTKKVREFWEESRLDTRTNVQFGEGGAGTFSDGKLNTGIKNIRCRYVLEEFVRFGAPENILYEAKPHVGTDYLVKVVKGIRNRIIECGGDVRFKNRLEDILIKDDRVIGARISDNSGIYEIKTEDIVLAIGHSAIDTFNMLKSHNIEMIKKPFSVGVRIEHKQEMINYSQYGKFSEYLDNADYKLAVHLKDGRGVYTFCMCPGGYVVNSASEEGRIVTNGMSYNSRSGENANSAVLVSVTPEDISGDDAMSGFLFQKKIEEKAYILGGKNYFAPCQRVGDFLKGQPSVDRGAIVPTIKPGVKYTDISEIFPKFIVDALKEALPEFNKKLKGFSDDDAVITAPETRSSSPVRVVRDAKTLQSVSLKGLYPCGEGAGYAGGIMSAATDGILCAESVIL